MEHNINYRKLKGLCHAVNKVSCTVAGNGWNGYESKANGAGLLKEDCEEQ